MTGFAIKVGADTAPFEAGMKAALTVAGQTAAQISARYALAATGIDKAFAQTARNVGVSFGKGMMDSVSPAALAIGRTSIVLAGIAAAYASVTVAIGQANAQLDKFIALGANADRAGVGVEFFQKFSQAAKDAKLDVQEIEKALISAGKAVTPKFQEDDPIKKSLTDVFESGYTGDFQSKGLEQYRAANTNEERIRAAVTAMQELRDVVGQTAAVDLAQKLFGTETADRIRSGRLDIDAIAASLDRQREDLITQAQVQQAQDFRDRLNEAYSEIDKALGVSVNLAGAGQEILDVWLATVQAVASVTSALDPLIAKIGEAKTASQDMMGALATAFGAQAVNQYLFPNQGKTIYPADDPATTPVPIAPPVPPRRPLDFFTDPTSYGRGGTRAAHSKPAKSSAPATETLDQVESFINGVERSTEALKAEAEAIGKSSAERQTAINLARVEALARQQGITLTEDQIAKVKELSKATTEYRDTIDDAREHQEAFRSIGGDVLKGIASDARAGASGIDILTSALDRLTARLSDKAMDSLADALFGKSGGTDGGPLTKFMSSIFGSAISGGSGNGLGSIGGSPVQGPPAPPGFATGVTALGEINGPGTETSDSILAQVVGPRPSLIRVSKGESIINAKATRENRGLIQAMNAGTIKRYATGGTLDDVAASMGNAVDRIGNADTRAAAQSGSSAEPGMKVEVVNKGTPQQVESAKVDIDGRGQRRLVMQMGDVVAAGSKTPQGRAAMGSRRVTKQ